VNRTLAALGIVAVAALAGATAFAVSRADQGGSQEGLNPSPPAERVRVEVLNAGGVSGKARAATEALRDIGFDVVSFGNAGTFDRASTSVVDRVGRPELARAVADVLGVSDVVSDPDPNLFVDVTVLLGRDWNERGGDTPPPEREPWDPRGWIGR
jgi:LytR cell envelope-related transcriptional attenuator